MPLTTAFKLIKCGRCSEADMYLDLWLSTIYDDPRVVGSDIGPIVYLRNGTGNPLLNYTQLADWLFYAEAMALPEFDACTKAYHNWFHEIIHSMDVPWTNGYIEGCNNKTKVLKCVSYGMPNFNNFRKRILFCNS